MQSGNALSSARLFLDTKPVTKVDIYPDKKIESADAGSAAAKGSPKDLFGEDGLTFRDVLDAVNPLNHIPIVSDILKEVTGHQVSSASRLIGGTLLGGPIGFVTALAGVIFEDATGSSPVNAVYAALSGESTTQLASAKPSEEATVQVAENTAADVAEEKAAQAETADAKPMELASLSPAATRAIAAPVSAVSATPSKIPTSLPAVTRQAVLDLYGNSPASAHSSYKKAQMLPYLRDVTTSKIL